MRFRLYTSERVVDIQAKSMDEAKRAVEAMKPKLPKGWSMKWYDHLGGTEGWRLIVRNSKSIVQQKHCARLVQR